MNDYAELGKWMFVSIIITLVIIIIVQIGKLIADHKLKQKIIHKSILKDRLRSCEKEIHELEIRKESPNKIVELKKERDEIKVEIEKLR